ISPSCRAPNSDRPSCAASTSPAKLNNNKAVCKAPPGSQWMELEISQIQRLASLQSEHPGALEEQAQGLQEEGLQSHALKFPFRALVQHGNAAAASPDLLWSAHLCLQPDGAFAPEGGTILHALPVQKVPRCPPMHNQVPAVETSDKCLTADDLIALDPDRESSILELVVPAVLKAVASGRQDLLQHKYKDGHKTQTLLDLAICRGLSEIAGVLATAGAQIHRLVFSYFLQQVGSGLVPPDHKLQLQASNLWAAVVAGRASFLVAEQLAELRLFSAEGLFSFSQGRSGRFLSCESLLDFALLDGRPKLVRGLAGIGVPFASAWTWVSRSILASWLGKHGSQSVADDELWKGLVHFTRRLSWTESDVSMLDVLVANATMLDEGLPLFQGLGTLGEMVAKLVKLGATCCLGCTEAGAILGQPHERDFSKKLRIASGGCPDFLQSLRDKNSTLLHNVIDNGKRSIKDILYLLTCGCEDVTLDWMRMLCWPGGNYYDPWFNAKSLSEEEMTSQLHVARSVVGFAQHRLTWAMKHWACQNGFLDDVLELIISSALPVPKSPAPLFNWSFSQALRWLKIIHLHWRHPHQPCPFPSSPTQSDDDPGVFSPPPSTAEAAQSDSLHIPARHGAVLGFDEALGAELTPQHGEIAGWDEPIARIDPEEAARISDERWASFIESNAADAVVAGSTAAAHRGLGPITGGGDGGVILLSFSRHDAELEEVLLSSQPAARARNRGLDLKPAWANGAKVFTGRATSGPGARAPADPRGRRRRHLRCNCAASLPHQKAEARWSLLNVSSMSSSSSSATGSDQPEFSNAANSFSPVIASGDALLRGEGEFVVTVRRTFIHLQPEASLDTRSVASF
ncbi:unnamed protein product, partial [Polarella glacialis]